MSTLGAQTALYAEDRGLQVPMALEHGPVTSSGKAAPGPDPRIRHRTQIGMFRPIRMDHTNCLQVAIKTLQFLARWIAASRAQSRCFDDISQLCCVFVSLLIFMGVPYFPFLRPRSAEVHVRRHAAAV